MNIIAVAGATGNLGQRIVRSLLVHQAIVHVIARSGSDDKILRQLEKDGAVIFKIDKWEVGELEKACTGAMCVISALAGLRHVIIDAQKILLEAAIAAEVPRFIPSDYSLDFTKFSPGENRNLDIRREFHHILDNTSIKATSIFNGAFADLLLKEMPVIFIESRRILYWGDPDFPWHFTTIQNTAEYTAHAALDSNTPRYLHIAGDRISVKEIQKIMSDISKQKFRRVRPGGKSLLGFFIKITKTFAPGKDELYPPWQGMQYMHNMIDRRSYIKTLDNSRYPQISWTSIRQMLQQNYASKE